MENKKLNEKSNAKTQSATKALEPRGQKIQQSSTEKQGATPMTREPTTPTPLKVALTRAHLTPRIAYTYTVFHTPNPGETELAYEDSYYPHPEESKLSTNQQPGQQQPEQKLLTMRTRFAVADGVTNAYYSGRWATTLAKAYVESAEQALEIQNLRELAGEWHKNELEIIEGQFKWYEEENRKIQEERLEIKGGSATLCGLELIPVQGESNKWHSIAVGDSCLFQIRDLQIIAVNPKMTATSFTNKPKQISTRRLSDPKCDPKWKPVSVDAEGEFLEDDVFILATDCMAQWILSAESRREEVERIEKLLSIQSNDEFEEFIKDERERNANHMHPDDMTLSIIRISRT